MISVLTQALEQQLAVRTADGSSVLIKDVSWSQDPKKRVFHGRVDDYVESWDAEGKAIGTYESERDIVGFWAPTGWQPIDTAPLGNKVVLVYCNGGIYSAAYLYVDEELDYREWMCDGDTPLERKPLFWQPLPPPPKGGF